MNAARVPVTVVIVTWNGLSYTRQCLRTLRANTAAEPQIIVVDNGSRDGTIEFLAASAADSASGRGSAAQDRPVEATSLRPATQSGLRLIRNSSNVGFARANNQAIREAPAGHDIVLLNNDVELCRPDWLERLQEAAYSAPDVGVVGCRLVDREGTLRHAGAWMPSDTLCGWQIGGGERDVNQYNRTREVESVVFACVYLRRAALDAVGPLDEDYFCYFEDTDFCLRAARAGWRTLCCGETTLIHHENVSTRVNDVSLQPLYREAQQVFRRKWGRELERRTKMRIGWRSTFTLPLGYGAASAALAVALERRGVSLAYRYVYGPGTPVPQAENPGVETPPVAGARARRPEGEAVQVVFAQGDVFASNPGPYRIGYTMLETDGVPSEWVRQANAMDEVWVPSAFNRETFRASGVTVPLHVMPLGVDPDYFNPRILRAPLEGVYVFLSIFEWGERKAPELLLRAFNTEFRAAEPAILIVKTSNLDPRVDVERTVREWNLDPRGGRIHLSLNQMVPAHQRGVLYRSADCFVLPTRGEGWGMPALEAMACGLPAIVTDWSAQREFLTEENSYPLPIEGLTPAEAKCPYYAGFRWAEPSCAHLRRLMRHVFENREEARARGLRAAEEVAARWTWERSAERMARRLEEIQSLRQ